MIAVTLGGLFFTGLRPQFNLGLQLLLCKRQIKLFRYVKYYKSLLHSSHATVYNSKDRNRLESIDILKRNKKWQYRPTIITCSKIFKNCKQETSSLSVFCYYFEYRSCSEIYSKSKLIQEQTYLTLTWQYYAAVNPN